MKRPFHILLLPKELYPTARVRLTILFEKELAKRGHSLYWIMQSKTSGKGFVKKIENNNYYIFSSFGINNQMCRVLNRLLSLRKLYIALKITKSYKVDIIQAGDGIVEGIVGIYLQRKYNIPLCFYLSSLFFFFSEDNFKLHKNINTLLRYLVGKLCKRIYVYIIRKSQLFQPMSKYLGLHYHIFSEYNKQMPLPVCGNKDFIDYGKICASLNTKFKNPQDLVYVGQISSLRRLEFAIIVLKNIIQSGISNIRLLFIGPPQDQSIVPTLEKFSDKLGIKKNVEFIGEVPYGHIPKYLAVALIGLSPIPPTKGYVVSSPTKCIEYLSLGLPVVANNEIHEQKEILEKSGGGFAVRYNEKEFADAIIWLLKHPEEAKRIGKKGREWIEKNRTYEQLSYKLEERYCDVIKKGVGK